MWSVALCVDSLFMYQVSGVEGSSVVSVSVSLSLWQQSFKGELGLPAETCG